jgi:hypothetical protein
MDIQSAGVSLGKRSPVEKLDQADVMSREEFPRDIIGSDIFKNKSQNKISFQDGKFKKLKI